MIDKYRTEFKKMYRKIFVELQEPLGVIKKSRILKKEKIGQLRTLYHFIEYAKERRN